MTPTPDDLPPCTGKQGWPWNVTSHSPRPAMPTRSALKFSIVTPNRNGGRYLEETIRSVLLQNYPNCEYIVIDGGSTDESVETIRKYAPWLRYWTSEPDSGQPNAINKGLMRCTGDIVAFLNSDDLYLPGAFERVAQLFAGNQSAEWVMGACDMWDETGTGSWLWEPDRYEDLRDFIRGNPGSQPSTFLRSSVFRKLGSFAEDLHYSFDHEFWVRMACAGLRPLTDNTVLSRFRLHEASKSCSQRDRFVEDDIEIARRYLDLLAPKDQITIAEWMANLRPAQIARPQNVRKGLLETVQQIDDIARTDRSADFPLVSCVMPTYGRPDFVHEAAAMFLAQDYPAKELIVLNDCPGQTFHSDHPEIRVINAETRFPSLGEKRNATMEAARGEYVAIWDDDDVYLPWRLSHSISELQLSGSQFYRPASFYFYFGDEILTEITLDDSEAIPSHPATMFRKSLWEAVGGYPALKVSSDRILFDKIHAYLGATFIRNDIDRIARFFIMRCKSRYQHTSIGGGLHPPDTAPGNFPIAPRPIEDRLLRRCYSRLSHFYGVVMASSRAPDPARGAVDGC